MADVDISILADLAPLEAIVDFGVTTESPLRSLEAVVTISAADVISIDAELSSLTAETYAGNHIEGELSSLEATIEGRVDTEVEILAELSRLESTTNSGGYIIASLPSLGAAASLQSTDMVSVDAPLSRLGSTVDVDVITVVDIDSTLSSLKATVAGDGVAVDTGTDDVNVAILASMSALQSTFIQLGNTPLTINGELPSVSCLVDGGMNAEIILDTYLSPLEAVVAQDKVYSDSPIGYVRTC